tara:strand:- start:44 stop:421 length:378 start_codon:yes stop_codon:yes gene_type:complete
MNLDPTVPFVILMLIFSVASGNLEMIDGRKPNGGISEGCEYITAEVVEKGRVDDGFQVNYLKVIGTSTDSTGEMYEVKLSVIVNPITYTKYEVGETYTEMLCEDPQSAWDLLGKLLDEDWLNLWE